MDACRICTLIFDRAPLELGRAVSDNTIYCICEEVMETNTRIKTIKVHTLVIDDTEIEAYLNDPDPLIDVLRDLLIKPAPNGNGHAPSPMGEGRGEGGEGRMSADIQPERGLS